jgi:hypothetical protein
MRLSGWDVERVRNGNGAVQIQRTVAVLTLDNFTLFILQHVFVQVGVELFAVRAAEAIHGSPSALSRAT